MPDYQPDICGLDNLGEWPCIQYLIVSIWFGVGVLVLAKVSQAVWVYTRLRRYDSKKVAFTDVLTFDIVMEADDVNHSIEAKPLALPLILPLFNRWLVMLSLVFLLSGSIFFIEKESTFVCGKNDADRNVFPRTLC
jgi:hypothetical protein